MREIIFRGKREDDDKWIYGFYSQFHNRPLVNEPNSHQIFELKDEGIRFAGTSIGGLWHIIDENTIGQYTGLTDKNGTKIFEGDIVRWENIDDYGEVHKSHNHEILFDDKYFYSFVASRDYGRDVFTKMQFSFNDIRKNNIEVIGNKWDNPELLGGDNDTNKQ